MIALIDYRAGNLTSVVKALRAIGAEVFVPDTAGELSRASSIIVPGVGHFGATRALDDEWRGAIRAHVEQGRRLFGICLGMQWLYDGSDEAPDVPGLGLFAGRCYRLGRRPGPTTAFAKATAGEEVVPHGHSIKIPHVGWNTLAIARADTIVDSVPDASQVYFTHSYAAPITDDTVAVTDHGERFAAVVQRGHIGGVQFHPEKSGDTGLRILRNFLGP